MLTITQKLHVSNHEKNTLLTKGIDYLNRVRKQDGCLSFQLNQDIEIKNVFYFVSNWESLQHVKRFFQHALNFYLTSSWNIFDHTIELDCKLVNQQYHDSNLKRDDLLNGLNQLAKKSRNSRNSPEIKYASSHLTQEQLNEYLQRIRSFMAESESYKQKDLTLLKFAKDVGLHSHHVSRVINEKLEQNFSDFVNSYRVAQAKKLLVQDLLKRYTISGIGDESGFNSRSAFYNAFRKFAGMSPGEFILRNQTEAQVA